MLKKMLTAIELEMIRFMGKMTKSERGDTNFISIMIVLGIVILVAGVFIGFKDEILGQVEKIVGGFTIDGTSPT